MLTKQHYRLIAAALHSAGVSPDHEAVDGLVDAFRKDNPRFMPAVFLAAVRGGLDNVPTFPSRSSRTPNEIRAAGH